MTQYAESDIDIFQQFESYDFDSDDQFQEGWQSILCRLGNSVTKETLLNAKVFFFSRQVNHLDLNNYLDWKKTSRDEDCPENGATSSSTSQVSARNDNPIIIDEEKVKEDVPELESKSQLQADYIAANSEPGGSQQTHVSSCTVDSVSSASESAPCSISAAKVFASNTPIVYKKEQQLKLSSDQVLGENTAKSDITSQSIDAENKRSTESVENQHTLSQATSTHAPESTDNQPTLNLAKCTHATESTENEPTLSLAEIAELIQNQLPIPGLVKLDVQPTNSSPTPSALARKSKPWMSTQEECD